MLDDASKEVFISFMIGEAARDTHLWLRAFKDVADESLATEYEPPNIEEEAYIRVAGHYTLGPEHREQVLEQRRQYLEEELKRSKSQGSDND